jgi:hypothetical protein
VETGFPKRSCSIEIFQAGAKQKPRAEARGFRT